MKVVMTRYRMSLVIFASFIIIGGPVIGYPSPSQEVKAQHHGAPPPAAAIGDRKLLLEMKTVPMNITKGDDVLMTIGFLDEGKMQIFNM